MESVEVVVGDVLNYKIRFCYAQALSESHALHSAAGIVKGQMLLVP